MSGDNITNLNIFTFIREIYQSLKHLDVMLNTMNISFTEKLSKLDDQQQQFKYRLENIETLLQKNLDSTQNNNTLNKTIEGELLSKLNKINTNTQLMNKKIDLKPNEMTLANILENDYNFNDINKQLNLSNINSINKVLDNPIQIDIGTTGDTTHTTQNDQPLESLLF